MTPDNFRAAVRIAKEFLKAAEAVEKEIKDQERGLRLCGRPVQDLGRTALASSKHTGLVRHWSVILTRHLADMRKPQ